MAHDIERWILLNRLNGDDSSKRHGLCSAIVVFRHRLDVPDAPGTVTGSPFESLNLSQKLDRECSLSPEALIARVAAETHLHITRSRFEGSSQNAQLLFIQFEKHHHAVCSSFLCCEYSLDPSRHGLSCRSIVRLIKEPSVVRWFQIDLAGSYPKVLGLLDEPCGGIDRPRSSN
jgi:hypothetical protein